MKTSRSSNASLRQTVATLSLSSVDFSAGREVYVVLCTDSNYATAAFKYQEPWLDEQVEKH
jgi:hypothetical protein